MPVVRAGDIICESAPYAFAVGDCAVHNSCAFCLKSSKAAGGDVQRSELKRCSRCQFLQYCSRQCQAADWKDHKGECANMKRVSPNRPSESLRLLARMHLRSQREKDNPTREVLLDRGRSLDDCMSHVDAVKKDKVRLEAFMSLYRLLNIYLTKEQLAGRSMEEFIELFGKLCVNVIQVSWDDMPCGAALYLGPSMIDHSCAANIQGLFKGQNIVLKALQEFTADAVSDLRIAYIDVATSKQRRQEELQKVYYFHCECDRCSGKIPEVITEKDSRLTDKILALRTQLLKEDSGPRQFREILSSLESMLSNELRDLEDSDGAKFTALMVAADAAVMVENYHAAYKYSMQSLPVMEKAIGRFNPAYAYKLVALARVSTIVTSGSQSVEEFNRTMDLLKKSIEVCKVALGEDNFHTKDIQLLVEELKQSLARKAAMK